MADVFISYSSADQQFANFLYNHLTNEGISTFMASASIKPGQKWSEEIFANLRSASWILFLASKEASNSAYVQQELGIALSSEKKLVPIVWDMPSSELPGWVDRTHALNLAGATVDEIKTNITKIANRIKSDKTNGLLIGGLLLAGLFILMSE